MSKIYEFTGGCGCVKGAVAIDGTDNKVLGTILKAYQDSGIFANLVDSDGGAIWLTKCELHTPKPPVQRGLPFDGSGDGEDVPAHIFQRDEQQRIDLLLAWGRVWSQDDEINDMPGTQRKKEDLVSRTTGRISALRAGIAPASDDDLLFHWTALYPGVDALSVAAAVESNEPETEAEGAETCGVLPRIDVGPGTAFAEPGMDVRASRYLQIGFGALMPAIVGPDTVPIYVDLSGEFNGSGDQKVICPECLALETVNAPGCQCEDCCRDMLPIVDRARALVVNSDGAVPAADPDFFRETENPNE